MVLVPLPFVMIPPGVLVKVHAPLGNPFKTTLAVTNAHVGWVIVPMVGAVTGAQITLIE